MTKNKLKKNIKSSMSTNILEIKETLSEHLLNKEIPFKKIKNKISDENFYIPKLCEYMNIVNINYNMQQIKMICKKYNLKITGNKNELNKRIYNYMYYTYYSCFIQKIFRKILVKNYITLHGPGFYNKELCTNDSDFATLDYITRIPYYQFFSFKDEDNFIYGFDILSIYNLYLKNKQNICNPLSTKKLNNNVYNQMIDYIKYSNLLKIEININYESLEKITETKKIENDIFNLFQQMDSLGNYTDSDWLTNLNKNQLIRFLRELADLWTYRANLSQKVKEEISPRYGNPFRSVNININSIQNYSFLVIKKSVISIIDELINKGINNDSKSLGCYYVLACLTLVNPMAANALPWLYESVIY